MKTSNITQRQARQMALQSQGLLQSASFGKGKEGIVKALQRMTYVQIDTISVVERAHHHTLWTRLPDYQKSKLLDLQANERLVWEYWSHAAAYLPIDDFRFSLPRMNRYANGKQHWTRPETNMKDFVMDRIKAEGPLRSKDFEKPVDFETGMWNWKPAKRALEQLFMEGKLMISARTGFQKVYDLTENVLPSHVKTELPTPSEMADYLILSAIEAHGLVSYEQIPYLRSKETKDWVKARIPQLLEDKIIEVVKVEGIPSATYYTTPQQLSQLEKIAHNSTEKVHILSPFDNVVIQRKRLKELFDYDYTIECYVPAPKRVYGYFCLPILWGTQFIGRLDAKADRKLKTFFLRNLVFESHFTLKNLEAAMPDLVQQFWVFAQFNGCEKIEVERVVPREFGDRLVEAMRRI
ncbi:MAG: crosslink repair DNA glycosylase YcaQ family protein [Chitinophagales bacterium]